MAFVIAETCVDVKDGICTEVCPVDCIYEGGRMFYIQPDECIDCALCVSVCPVEAIFSEDAIPDHYRPYTAINAEFFGAAVTGWGSPRGFESEYITTQDHPLVERMPPRAV